MIFTFEEKKWARFSACVYNSIEDYEYAGNSFLKVLKKEEWNNYIITCSI